MCWAFFNFGFPHSKMCLQCSSNSAVLFPMHMTLVRKKIKASAKGGRTEERYSCSTADAACKMWHNVCVS